MLEGGDGPWRITFDTNPSLCNLHCIMCEEHSRFCRVRPDGRRLMDPDLIEAVINETVPHGLKGVIPSTMGEPLLYPWFDRILDSVRSHGIKTVSYTHLRAHET